MGKVYLSSAPDDRWAPHEGWRARKVQEEIENLMK